MIRTKYYKPQEKSRRANARAEADANQLMLDFNAVRDAFAKPADAVAAADVALQAARDVVIAALDEFGRVARNMAAGRASNHVVVRNDKSPTPSKPPLDIKDAEVYETRKAVRSIVGNLRILCCVDWSEMWTLVYDEHYARSPNRYHPIAASRGRKSHLAKVVKDGELFNLYDTVIAMLKDDRFRRPQRVP
jgi:hypothetical protein